MIPDTKLNRHLPQPTNTLPASIDWVLSNCPVLNQADIDKTDRYYLLYWEGKYLLSQFSPPVPGSSGGETITHQDITYKIRFVKGCNAWQVVCESGAQYRLSFRRKTGDKIGTVLIWKGW